MEVLTEMDEYFNAMQKINMDEPVMPYVKGRLVESATYNKLRKIMETPELEKAHPYCYDLDPEQLEDCDVAKINNLYQLGVDRGFIEDDFQYQDPEDSECCDGSCQDEPAEPAEEAPVPVNPRAKIPCFVAMYSAMKDGQIKTGEAYSRAISVQAAKADVIAQLSRFGYSNISILAIEATEEDACECTLNEGNLGKYVGMGLGAFGGAAMGSGIGSNFGGDGIGSGIGGLAGAVGGGWLGSKIGDEAGDNVQADADIKFGKDAKSSRSSNSKRKSRATTESEDEEPAEEAPAEEEPTEEEPAEEPAEKKQEKPKKKAKKSKKEPTEKEPAEEPAEEAPAEEEPADDGADDMFGLAGDEGSTDGGEADNQTDDSNIEADTGNDAETADANQEENSDDTQEEVPASNDEQPAEEPAEEAPAEEEPAEEPAEEAPAEEEPAEEENDKEEELDPNKKAELKDNYKKIFKNTMLKCKFEDRSFDDLTLKEKVKFFTELAKTWKEGYEPPAFMSDKEVDQLEKTVVKKQ